MYNFFLCRDFFVSKVLGMRFLVQIHRNMFMALGNILRSCFPKVLNPFA